MKARLEIWRIAARAVSVSALVLGIAVQVFAQPVEPAKKAPVAAPLTESQTQARAILMRMAEFLAGAQSFSVNIRDGYDAVQKSGQKIEFGDKRNVILSRPDRLRVEGERSDGTKTQTVFNGKEIVLVDTTSNVYATAPQPGSVDDTVVYFVRDLGIRFPLARMLVSRLPAELENRVQSVDYVEKTSIDGVPCHHLAARSDTVDFQVWVADGDKPLPHRLVITYKKATGQPQFWAQFSDWDMTPAITDSTFLLQVDGLRKIAFAAQLPRTSPTARKASANKGAKR
jgi:hypothetical protein